jgi:hypothetical protein
MKTNTPANMRLHLTPLWYFAAQVKRRPLGRISDKDSQMKIAQRLERSMEIILILWFVVAMYLQQNVGLADNGDFTRAMTWVSTGPIGIEPNWPAANTEDWSKRFFNFWIPYWKLELNMSIPTTSAFVLWLPGALLNKFLYSGTVLYLPSLSLLPKLLLFGVL